MGKPSSLVCSAFLDVIRASLLELTNDNLLPRWTQVTVASVGRGWGYVMKEVTLSLPLKACPLAASFRFLFCVLAAVV